MIKYFCSPQSEDDRLALTPFSSAVLQFRNFTLLFCCRVFLASMVLLRQGSHRTIKLSSVKTANKEVAFKGVTFRKDRYIWWASGTHFVFPVFFSCSNSMRNSDANILNIWQLRQDFRSGAFLGSYDNQQDAAKAVAKHTKIRVRKLQKTKVRIIRYWL